MISISNNQKIINESKTLIDEVVAGDENSVEKTLSRTAKRIMGFVCGFFLLAPFPTLLYVDSYVDGLKIRSIEDKLKNLHSTELNSSDNDFNEAIIGRDFQKNVYTNILNYTKTAKTIKVIQATGLVASTLLPLLALIIAQLNPNKITPQTVILTASLTSGVAVGGLVANIGHWYFGGEALDQQNLTLAVEAHQKLESPA
jgi:hypothetical protein